MADVTVDISGVSQGGGQAPIGGQQPPSGGGRTAPIDVDGRLLNELREELIRQAGRQGQPTHKYDAAIEEVFNRQLEELVNSFTDKRRQAQDRIAQRYAEIDTDVDARLAEDLDGITDAQARRAITNRWEMERDARYQRVGEEYDQEQQQLDEEQNRKQEELTRAIEELTRQMRSGQALNPNSFLNQLRQERLEAVVQRDTAADEATAREAGARVRDLDRQIRSIERGESAEQRKGGGGIDYGLRGIQTIMGFDMLARGLQGGSADLGSLVMGIAQSLVPLLTTSDKAAARSLQWVKPLATAGTIITQQANRSNQIAELAALTRGEETISDMRDFLYNNLVAYPYSSEADELSEDSVAYRRRAARSDSGTAQTDTINREIQKIDEPWYSRLFDGLFGKSNSEELADERRRVLEERVRTERAVAAATGKKDSGVGESVTDAIDNFLEKNKQIATLNTLNLPSIYDLGLSSPEFAQSAANRMKQRGMLFGGDINEAYFQEALERVFSLNSGALGQAGKYDRYGVSQATDAIVQLVSALERTRNSGVSEGNYIRVQEFLNLQQSIMQDMMRFGTPNYDIANRETLALANIQGYQVDSRSSSDLQALRNSVMNPQNERAKAILYDVVQELDPSTAGRSDLIEKKLRDENSQDAIISAYFRKIQQMYGGTDTQEGWHAMRFVTQAIDNPVRAEQLFNAWATGKAGQIASGKVSISEGAGSTELMKIGYASQASGYNDEITRGLIAASDAFSGKLVQKLAEPFGKFVGDILESVMRISSTMDSILGGINQLNANIVDTRTDFRTSMR